MTDLLVGAVLVLLLVAVGVWSVRSEWRGWCAMLRARGLEPAMVIEQALTDRFGVEEINGDGMCPTYLYRWTLFRVWPRWKFWQKPEVKAGEEKPQSLAAIYLHKFVGDDWARDLHDHPKRFVSIGLVGGYTEWTRALDHAYTPRSIYPANGSGLRVELPNECGWVTNPALDFHCNLSRAAHEQSYTYRAPWVRTFPATHTHRLTGPTPERPCWTLILVGPPVREWGFWVRDRWVEWSRYVHGPDGKAGKACP